LDQGIGGWQKAVKRAEPQKKTLALGMRICMMGGGEAKGLSMRAGKTESRKARGEFMQTFTMKRVLLVGGVSAAICLTSAFSASAQNLLIDPSEEIGTAASAGGWNTTFGGVRSTAFSRTPATPPAGGHSIRDAAGGVPDTFQGPTNPNLTNVTAGAQFDFTGFGLVTNSIVSGFGGIQASFFSAAGVNLGTVETSPGNAKFSNRIDSNNVVISTGVLGNQTWIPLDTGVFTAPAGTAYLEVFTINVNLVESNGSAGVWYDDLSLVAVPEPSSIALGAMGLIAGVSILARRRRSR
jgi:PEP-CTERM motif